MLIVELGFWLLFLSAYGPLRSPSRLVEKWNCISEKELKHTTLHHTSSDCVLRSSYVFFHYAKAAAQLIHTSYYLPPLIKVILRKIPTKP